MERIYIYINEYMSKFYIPELRFIDVIEILIIAIFLYRLVDWIQNTKAWMLLRGILVIGAFMIMAMIFNMQTILYIAKNSLNVLAVSTIVVFQPEIRRALENIGQNSILNGLNFWGKKKDMLRFDNKIKVYIEEACKVMANDKTGALIVIQQDVKLSQYSETGIPMDSLLSSQLLLNIFEHNTPLHDGAVIVSGDRIVASTCYLPLSENMHLSKNLGTRHRAAIGLSEVSDALVVVVSEESGAISVALNGKIHTKISTNELSHFLLGAQKYKNEKIQHSINDLLKEEENEK